MDAPLGEDRPGRFVVVVDTPAQLRDQVDMLFVIDNSDNMLERQEQLSASFSQVLAQLSFGRGLPDLHIGFVATDIGVGIYGGKETGCSSEGRGGKLEPLVERGCSLAADPFLSARLDAEGNMITNFSGELSDAFSCMVKMGETGCEYEQPLEAMRRALDSSLEQNLAFLRPDAVLSVVVLTNEDDCSATNSELFNPNNPAFAGDDPNFRCFQAGVICDGDDVYRPGQRDNCHPYEGSPYVHDISEYVAYLEDLKPLATDRLVTAIIGDPTLVSVLVDDENNSAQLRPACEDELGNATYPGVRLGAFVDEFSATGELSSLCDAGPALGLKGMIHNLRQSLGTTCLEGAISDIDLATPGRQEDCIVYEQRTDIQSSQEPVPKCDKPGDLIHSSELPCYTIQTGGEACGDFRTQLALQIHGRSFAPNINTRLVAECRVDE